MEYLTIRQAKNELEKLNNQLELYLEKKKINFERTQPKSTRLKEIVVSGSIQFNDPFINYVIKDVECDDKIYALKESILSYQKYIIKELKRLSKYDDMELIIYLKEELDWNWNKIDKYLNYAEDTSRTKYKRFKKDTEKA